MVVGSNAYIVRPANNVEEASALWCPLIQELGWNRAATDLPAHYRAASSGQTFLVLIHASTSQAEGCIVPLTYPNGTGWVGFFLMNAAFRGRGLGAALWKEMEECFAESGTRVVGLDAVREQVERYKKSGFKEQGSVHVMTRESLKTAPLPPLDGDDAGTDTIRDIRSVDAALLAQLDLAHTGLDRTAYWSKDGLLAQGDTSGFVILSSSPSSPTPELEGLILIRPCPSGHRIGPLYATSTQQACILLRAAMSKLADSEGSLVAEVFGMNSEARGVFEDLGWEAVDVYTRMWLGGRVPSEQSEGGRGTQGMFAVFDAGAG
ncbi:hypothetical protein P153DRAFT_366197 [Dothidotthia symphoricarpi CBS 119687]|uniref:N-acetyltransferase domain-containing protein n=1 Tax=Dothidotthia symphoricarpi CBS 119687 TaxID=1392245 RepID=A0A6A6AIA6_9PLEO|nr:uncharacterized protein P153DRAFT_366197 [Dothidotthia symphoricarpi CBS 119687]KAF2130637.1 hypothetical protein P153DRAFT_366197 [Dothidotthia symphoricarpi CBS 119687]